MVAEKKIKVPANMIFMLFTINTPSVTSCIYGCASIISLNNFRFEFIETKMQSVLVPGLVKAPVYSSFIKDRIITTRSTTKHALGRRLYVLVVVGRQRHGLVQTGGKSTTTPVFPDGEVRARRVSGALLLLGFRFGGKAISCRLIVNFDFTPTFFKLGVLGERIPTPFIT